MPIDFFNYGDNELGKTSSLYGVSFRYQTLFYHAILNVGSNEFGPVNNEEFMFLIFSLIISAILMSIVFGDVAGLIAVSDQKNFERQ